MIVAGTSVFVGDSAAVIALLRASVVRHGHGKDRLECSRMPHDFPTLLQSARWVRVSDVLAGHAIRVESFRANVIAGLNFS